MKKRVFAMVLVLAMMVSLVPGAAAAVAKPAKSCNDGFGYTGLSRNWNAVTPSYLFQNDSGGLTRVESIGKDIVVEDYSAGSYRLLSSRLIPRELSLWGGFFAGEEYNFFVFGQNVPEGDSSLEAFRVVKYSKDWERLGQANVYEHYYNAMLKRSTAIPFDAGALQMAEYGGMLVVRTGHEMHNGHQSNRSILVRQSDMTVDNQSTDLPGSPFGYVSHSFNQLLAIDENGLMAGVDHGDAYPRAIALTRFQLTGDNGLFGDDPYGYPDCDMINLLEFPGEVGENYTGATVTGLAFAGDNILVAGRSVRLDDNYFKNEQHNIYLAVAPKAANSPATLRWVTDVTEDDGDSQYSPVLVGLGDGTALLLLRATRRLDGIDVMRVDSNGAQIGETAFLEGHRSLCQPIVADGKVIWYATYDPIQPWYALNGIPRFYELDVDTMQLKVTDGGVGDMARFTPNRTYPAGQFQDAGDAWYTPNVTAAYEYGLMEGTAGDAFSPDAQLTTGEAVALAARIYARYMGDEVDFSGGSPWYKPYVDYAKANDVLPYEYDYTKPCSRQVFAFILARSLSYGEYPPLRGERLFEFADKDDFDGDGFRLWSTLLYRAGVVNGTGEGADVVFNPDGLITRKEVSAILTRMVDPTMRAAA